MNKLFKKLFVLLLALTVAFAAVGCDDCDGDNGGDSYVPDTSVVQPEPPVITMKAERNLIVGDEVYLSPTTKNVDGDLVWVSENPDVATVSNGIVSAIKSGNTKITASYGGVTASCNVTVSYGSFIPNVATYSGIELEGTSKTILSVGSAYALGAYVDFNNNVFNDATFTYESSNEEILTVDANGTVTPVKSGDNVVITVNATWRDFTVSKSFSVDVRDNVLFFVDGDILQNIVVNTPASFISVEDRDNVINFNPTVKVGPEATVDSNVSVEVIPMDGTVVDVDYSFNATSKVYTALGLGKTLVKMAYTYEGVTYESSFMVEAVRPVKEISLPVELYSAGAGTYKVDNGDGTYTNRTLVDYAWGNGTDVTDVTLYDAYQEGEALPVNGEIVENVKVNFDSYTDTSITLGTKTEIYVLSLKDAISYYISDANDLVGALEKDGKTFVSNGLYVLLNDIDMTDAPAIKNHTGVFGFYGIFDGKGHVIYNPVVDMSASKSGGFLGTMQAGSVFKNTALININSVKSQNLRGWLTTSPSATVSFENVYVDINESMPHRAGLFYSFSAKASNFIMNRPAPANFDMAEWFDTGANKYGSSAFATQTDGFSDLKTSKLNNVYLISRMPAQYYWTDSRLSEPYYVVDDNGVYSIQLNAKGKKRYGSTMGYGENETELHYVYDYFTNPVSIGGLGLENPTIDSVITAMGGNGKISVLPNFRVYDTFSELSLDNSDRHLQNLTEFSDSYWTIVDGMPIWNGVYKNTAIHDNYFGLTMGNQVADFGAVAYNYSSYELGLTSLNPSLVTELEFTVADNEYVTINNNVLEAKAESNGTTVTVTANFKYDGVAKTKTFEVEVINPFEVTVNNVITDDGSSLIIDGEYTLGITIGGTPIENVTYVSSDDSVLALKADTTDTFTALKAGTATITATFTYNDESQTRLFSVQVKDPILDSSVLKVNGAEISSEIEVSAYTTSTVEVILDEVAFDASKLTITSSNADVTVSGNSLIVSKYVENATSTINVTLTEKGRTYEYSFVLKVANPFKLKVANVEATSTGKKLDLYSESDLAVTVNDEVLSEGVTFSTTATNVTITDGKLTVNSLGEDATLTATFTYGQNVDETITIPVTFFDSVANNSVITADDVEVDGTGINLVVPDNTVIGVKYNGTAVDELTLSGNTDSVATVDGTTLSSVSNGSFILTVTFVVDGKNHVLTTPVSCVSPYKTIADPVNYEASTGTLITTAIEGDILGAIVGEEILDTANGGLVIDGSNVTFRAKTSLEDTSAGVPYKWNKDGESNVFEITVKTDVNTYVFTNVSYWSIIIDNADELKQAMGYNVDYAPVELGSTAGSNSLDGNILSLAVVNNSVYTLGKYNVGLYRLGTDIDMNKTDIGYTNNTLTSSKLGGYAGLLDGFGYSIMNFAPGTQGLVGVMNSYSYSKGTQVDEAFGASAKSIPFVPTVRNIAFENVITGIDRPVIALSTSNTAAYNYYTPVLENIYVTISSESTGSAGIICAVNKGTKTNNVYVVNNNEFGQFIELDNKYKFTDRNGAVTIPESRVYYNPLDATSSYRNVSLFGKIGAKDASIVTGSVSNTTNVYVVSKLPLMYYNEEVGKYMYSYTVKVDKTEKTASLYSTHLGGYSSKSKLKVYGYGANEKVGIVPTIYAIKPNVLTEFNTYYDIITSTTNNNYGSKFCGYLCPVCGEVTLAGGSATAADTACTMTENCDGTLLKNPGFLSVNSFWNTPAAYEWTLPNLETEAASDFELDNGTIRFASAYRYDSVDDMKSANLEFASFTGDAGNDLWKVVEGELIWVGAQA